MAASDKKQGDVFIMAAMIEVSELSFAYKDKRVIKGISFQVEKGALCGLFGPNGSGKTTLFKCCLNFLKPDSGTVVIGNKQVSSMSVSEMARIVSYVPQEHKPSFPFTVREIVLMGRSPYMGGIFGLKKHDYEAADMAMDMLGIADLAHIPASNLSGGQRQLAFIARAVAQNTPVMFLDEPTSALDFSNQIMIWQVLKKISEQGITIIACSHEPNHILWFCDKAVAISNGGVVACGEACCVVTEEMLSNMYGGKYFIAESEGKKIIHPKF